MIYVILGIVVIATFFPKLFEFLEAVWSFLWKIITYVIGGPLYILSKLGSGLFTVISGLMEGFGKVTAPLERLMTSSVIVPIIVLVALGGLYMRMDRSNSNRSKESYNFGLKTNYAWCCSAINFGLIVAGSGHPQQSLCGLINSYFADDAITLSIFSQWPPFAKGMLLTTLIGGMIAALIHACAGGLRSFIRTWVGYCFCGVLGYLLMLVRLAIFGWLGENLGFIGRILNIPMVMIETIFFIQFFFGIVAFILPSGMIAAINEARAEKDRHAASKSKSFDDNDDFGFASPKSVFPQTLTIGGEQYLLMHDSGDHAEYYCPKTGETKQIWDVELLGD